MKRLHSFMLIVCITSTTFAQQQPVDNSFGSLPPFTKWYQNPLGVSPISLHTGNGLYIPLIAATGILIFTKCNDKLDNRISLYSDIGYTKGYYGSFSNLTHQNTGLNYMLRKYLSAGVELSQVYVKDNENNTYGIGIRPFFRFYPLNKDGFKLYFQSGAGLQYFFNEFPQPSGFFGDNRKGTKLNGSPKYGIGTELKLNSNWNINAGIWHIHFSNGNNPSINRNPGHDSNGFSLGITFKPNKK
jgi:opacity protein-like surface antigen